MVYCVDFSHSHLTYLFKIDCYNSGKFMYSLHRENNLVYPQIMNKGIKNRQKYYKSYSQRKRAEEEQRRKRQPVKGILTG